MSNEALQSAVLLGSSQETHRFNSRAPVSRQTSLPTICAAVGIGGGQTLFADSQWASGDQGHREHSWLAQQAVVMQLALTWVLL